MGEKTAVLHNRLYAASAAILAIGIGCSIAIYLAADDDAALETGSSCTIPLANSKMYVREVQRFGGKAAVQFAKHLLLEHADTGPR